jgi:SAM-dependent methyltransferase
MPNDLILDAAGERAGEFWSQGDYGRIADLVTDMGSALVEAARVRPGMRVLDVAAGTGNASVPAALAGADVTATDVAPALLERAVGAAARRGAPIHSKTADARALPFEDDAFDVVMSTIGAMFAPDHERVAGELARVCRPGGVIAMANWPPWGAVGDFFEILARFDAAGPAPQSPLGWGDPGYVAGLLGPYVEQIKVERRVVTLAFTGTPRELVDCYREHFPPVLATFDALSPERVAALDAELMAFARRENSGADGRPARYVYEYVQVLASAR